MTDVSRRSVLGGCLAAAGLGAVRADDWPARPVTWLVPYPAGGGSDTFARPVAEQVAEWLGRPMVIDNRGGAGGTLGTAIVARAPADGYMLLVGDTGLTHAPTIYPRAGFDFVRDFAPISALARVPYVLVVNPQRLDVKSLGEFIDLARRHPDSIDIGSAVSAASRISRSACSKPAPACACITCPIAAARPCCRTCWPDRSRRPSC